MAEYEYIQQEGVCNINNSIKYDCHYYWWGTIMGSYISICRKRDNLKCDCDNCKYYISRQDADEIIELRRIRAEEVTEKCEDNVKED